MTYEASRRKQVLVLQPRGKALYEDSSSFGSKMLEKMGWKKGDGLGKSQSGNVDFIQIRYKNDEHGLGFNKFKMDDNWTKNETNFDDLLKSLNNQNGKYDQELTKKSLLEKSETSRSRVHYKKRVQCKDVQTYSEKDLANILGKKTLNEVDNNDVEKEIEEESSKRVVRVNETEEKNCYESLIVKSDKTSSDYFKEKMKKKRSASETEDDIPRPKKNKKEKTRDNENISIDTEGATEVFDVQSQKKDKRKNKGEIPDSKLTAKISKEILVSDVNSNSDSCNRSDPPAMNSKDISRGVNSVYGTNLIQIPSYIANKLASMNIDAFYNSNLANIIGYGMREDTCIRVMKTKLSENEGNITLDKYSLYNNDKLITKRVNPRKILSSIKKIKKSIQVI